MFDSIAGDYDRWYDSPEGQAVFDAELKCLRLICPEFAGRWLEAGVGSGRFASALGISHGVDPSLRMLEIAASRGVETRQGRAENLPFPEGSFDGVLMALVLCFVGNALDALKECRRVLRPDGRLLAGIIPADSLWGTRYAERASEGHPVYALAHFRTAAEIMDLAQTSGFRFIGAASTLFWKPDETPQAEPQVEKGILAQAGFAALLFEVSDESLMETAGKGDIDAFEQIIRRHQTWAWKIAYRFLGDKEEAEDIVQEAFLRLLDASGRYQATAKFRTYFYRIISRLCLDRPRKKRPLYLEEIPDCPDHRPDAAEELVHRETTAQVRAALDSLPPNQRMAVLLRYFDDLSYHEIAAALETTPKAVERLLARGRERLRAILGARDDFSHL